MTPPHHHRPPSPDPKGHTMTVRLIATLLAALAAATGAASPAAAATRPPLTITVVDQAGPAWHVRQAITRLNRTGPDTLVLGDACPPGFARGQACIVVVLDAAPNAYVWQPAGAWAPLTQLVRLDPTTPHRRRLASTAAVLAAALAAPLPGGRSIR